MSIIIKNVFKFSGVGVILGFVSSVASQAHEKNLAEEFLNMKGSKKDK